MAPDAELVPLCGADEEWLAQLDPATPLARVAGGLLERCVRTIGGAPATPERVRALPAGSWDALLVELWRRSLGPRVELVARCPAEHCRAGIDIDFDLGDLPLAPPADDAPDVLDGVEFRLPTGGDLEALADDPDPAALLDRCVAGEPPRDEATRAALERAVAERSAHVADELAAQCPECGSEFTISFLPLERLPAELARRRPQFERDVHVLSAHYGWTLTEILALPRPRRRDYVERLLAHLEAAPVPAAAGGAG